MSKYTNYEMEAMVLAIQPLLKLENLVGYAAARNTRVLTTEMTEYFAKRDALIEKYGEPELDEQGQPTGLTSPKIDSPMFHSFVDEMDPWGSLEHEPAIYRIPYEEAIGCMSGEKLLEVDWMFEDEEV